MKTPFIIAEISGNHLGSINRALDLIDAAAHAGADAVKLQIFTPEQMADADSVIADGPWAGKSMVELYREIHTPREWVPILFERARKNGITAFASVFHPEDVDFMETHNCPIYKISSFEMTDTSLIEYAAATGKPIIISTGMGSQQEIIAAVWAAYRGGCSDITLLRCTSAYPAPIEDANLATMQDMAGWSGADVGLSDHTEGHGCAVAATVLGAAVIEKHLTLSRACGGQDAAFSAEPHEFEEMVKACLQAAVAIGHVRYGPSPSEAAHVALRRMPGGKRGD